MTRIIFTLLLFFGDHLQLSSQEIVNAERAFALHAKENSIAAAFLKYMDSAAVVFNNGKITNGISYWSAVPPSQVKLSWSPVFAGIAASGELGFTTGPYDYRASAADSASGFGQYTTIWKKNRAGEWKFLVDLGINYSNHVSTAVSPSNFFTSRAPANPDTISVISIEERFIKSYQATGTNAYEDLLLKESWFNLNGSLPVQGSDNIVMQFKKMPAPIDYHIAGGNMSASRDMAVYGSTTQDDKNGNYLRVWVYIEG